MSGDIHVVPVNDIIEHEDIRQCWCRPRIERADTPCAIVVHHSADGREHFEPDASPGTERPS